MARQKRITRTVVCEVIIFLISFIGGLGQQEAGANDEIEGKLAVKAALERVAPAVVEVRASTVSDSSLGELFSGKVEVKAGAGFIVELQGRKFVLCGGDIIEGAESIEIRMQSGKVLEAQLLAISKWLNLAVLGLEENVEVPTAPLGDSSTVKVGDWVVALGMRGYTVDLGIVSALEQDVPSPEKDHWYRCVIVVQPSGTINRWNTGGPLVNGKGEVIGINLALVVTRKGEPETSRVEGFAFPINRVKCELQHLINQEPTPWLGIYMQELTPEIARHLNAAPGVGVLIADVAPNGPAAKAGLRTGDVILTIGGTPVRNTCDLQDALLCSKVGGPVDIEILRQGEKLKLTVTLGVKQPLTSPEPEESPEGRSSSTPEWMGVTVRDLTAAEAARSGVSEGVVVIDVRAGSAASSASFGGIRTGDVIVELNRKPVKNLAAWEELAEKIEPSSLLLTIIRDRRTLFVLVESTKAPPVAVVSLMGDRVYTNVAATFDASASYDPDGEIVKYQWDFDGDGVIDAEGVRVTWTFTEEGTYTVILIVIDNDGTTARKEVEIEVKVGGGGGPA